jgi:hypothetical protein
MNKIFAFVLFAFTLPVFSQQVTVPPITFNYPGVTFTIPQPDGTTIVVDPNTGKWEATPQTNLPAGMTFDGTTLKVPQISANKLSLTGGTTYASGTYLVSIDTSSNITYLPYTAPTGGGSTVFGTTLQVASSSIPASATVATSYTLSGVPAPGTPALVFVNPSIDLTQSGKFRYIWRVTAANTVTLYVTNTIGSAQTIPAYTLYMSAIK